MNREELIKKWLDHNLTIEEQIAFEQLEDSAQLIKLNDALGAFKAPKLDTNETYNKLKSNLNRTNQWFRPLLKVAAVLAIGLSIFYYTSGLDSNYNTGIAEQTQIELPDASIVNLNSNSTLTFNERKWSHNREVQLQGEGYFKVAKGQKFDVLTEIGIVSVLGTQFNVKQRTAYFEVTCYEGSVAVTHNNKVTTLAPGNSYMIIDGKLLKNKRENVKQPSWLIGESSFIGVPLKHVIIEFENQYNLKIKTANVDASKLFTGAFTHNNIDLALKSITIPLNLTYSKSEKSILLKRE